MRLPRSLAALLCLSTGPLSLSALDQNGNQQSDVWELVYGASGLTAGADADGDGWTNAQESAAGTNPFDANSRPSLLFTALGGPNVLATWASQPGKRYNIQTRADLTTGSWNNASPNRTGTGGLLQEQFDISGLSRAFFRLNATDQDTDGDGINDWEELALGFNPNTNRTDRFDQTDSQRIIAGLTAANVITVSAYRDTISERWPTPGVVVLRRTGGLRPLTVPLTFTGSANRGVDYNDDVVGSSVKFGAGVREVYVQLTPIADELAEPTETIIITAQTGTGYTLGANVSATVSLRNESATLPGPQAAARFLIQAAFGPDQDTDGNQIPQNVEEVMAIGFDAWITQQFARPIGLLQPFVQWANEQPASAEIYNDRKQDAWWGRAMGLPKLRPDAVATQLPDPLRQRVAFALSQIFVISDRMEDLAVDPEGMANYYDHLLTHSFGNYRDLLRGVALHPCMGIYLSHICNRKADPVAHTFPDENFAREIMQLFSIGLWMLNPDGTRILNGQGEPIPTYGNANITEFARVFTGLSFGGDDNNFGLYPRDFTIPMKGWDEEHDLGPKTLLLGVTTPARVASPGNTGTATLADVDAAIDNLFHHPNVGPFIGRLLIQRMVTSNPSPAYIGRVSAKFADDGNGVRGNMQAVVRQILLDPEARDASKLSDPTFGKLREPFLKAVNFARAFNARSPSGWYYLDAFTLDHVQEPLKAPSVFNYYLPTYAPPGAIAQAGLVAPEFQIINASSGVKAPNYYWNSTLGGLHRWGVGRADYNTTLDLDREMLMNIPPEGLGDDNPNVVALDPDPLLRRLDLVLTGGTLRPQSFQIIREAMNRLGFGIYDWPNRRLRLAIYLIVTSPEFAVQR